MQNNGFSRRYRPRNIKQIIGDTQLRAAQALLERAKKDEPVYEVLLTGPSGVGKTTIAQMYVRALLNLDEDEDIRKYITHVNCTANNGIDVARGILDELEMGSVFAKYRIYFLDELHGFTKQAQNAFLTETENLPDHVIMIGGTTDPQKLIETFHSRFREFKLKPPTDKNLRKRVGAICANLKKKIEPEVREKIIQACGGNIRILDKHLENWNEGVLNFGDNDVEDEGSLIHHLFFKQPDLKLWLKLSCDLDSYSGSSIGFCRYSMRILQNGNTNGNTAKRAAIILDLFSEGLADPIIPEDVIFAKKLLILDQQLRR